MIHDNLKSLSPDSAIAVTRYDMPNQQRFLARPLFLQVRDELAGKIATGQWRAGCIIPNEVVLAQEFGVSQGTMRKALDLLEAEKLVVRQQGRGTTVVDHDTEEMAIRFSSIFNEIGQRISGHVTSCAFTERGANAEESAALGIPPGDAIFELKRVRQYHAHPFMVEIVVLVSRYFPGARSHSLQDIRLTTLAQKCGVQLSHATERVTAALCPQEYASSLGISIETPILQLVRTTFSLRGDRVEYRKGWVHLREKTYISVTR